MIDLVELVTKASNMFPEDKKKMEDSFRFLLAKELCALEPEGLARYIAAPECKVEITDIGCEEIAVLRIPCAAKSV